MHPAGFVTVKVSFVALNLITTGNRRDIAIESPQQEYGKLRSVMYFHHLLLNRRYHMQNKCRMEENAVSVNPNSSIPSVMSEKKERDSLPMYR